MHISPQGKLGGAEAVIDVIAVGLGARVRPRVAVVTTSDALAKFYLGALNRMTLRSARFNDLSDALRQAKNINRPIDVLLIDTRGNVKGVPVIVRNLRKDAVTASLPIILVGRKQDIEKLRGVCAGTVTAILPVAAEYKAIKSAFDLALAGRKAPSPTADIRKQEDLLRRVLTTIAVLPPKTAYPVEELSDAIAGMISGYPEDIRLLALKCVKRIGDSAKRDTVMALYTDADTPLVVRREAGDVFVALLPANPGLSDRQVKLLRNLTADPDPKIAACAVRALAIADIPDQERKRHTLDVDQTRPPLTTRERPPRERNSSWPQPRRGGASFFESSAARSASSRPTPTNRSHPASRRRPQPKRSPRVRRAPSQASSHAGSFSRPTLSSPRRWKAHPSLKSSASPATAATPSRSSVHSPAAVTRSSPASVSSTPHPAENGSPPKPPA